MKSIDQFEEMQNTIQEYSKAVATLKEKLTKSNEEKKIILQMHEEFKLLFEKVKKETNDISKRYTETLSEKKAIEVNYESQIEHLKNVLNERQKIIEEFQSKALMPMDTEMLKTKLIREIELPLKAKNDEFKSEIERCLGEIKNLKRENSILKSKIESEENENKNVTFELKKRQKDEINILLNQIQSLSIKEDEYEYKEKEATAILKRQLEENRKKWQEALSEAQELRMSRDTLKKELSEEKMVQFKEKEELEIIRKKLVKENDILNSQIRAQKDELEEIANSLNQAKKETQKFQDEIETLKNENFMHINNIENLKREIETGDLKIKECENTLENHKKKMYEMDNDRAIVERKERSNLQAQIENLERVRKDLEEKMFYEISSRDKHISSIEKELSLLAEQEKEVKARLQNSMIGLESMRQNCENLMNQKEYLESELKILKNEKKDIMSKSHENIGTSAKIELTLRQMEESLIQSEQDKKRTVEELEKIRIEMSEMMKRHLDEKGRLEELVILGNAKAHKYKKKVLEANKKIKNIVLKLGVSENNRENAPININLNSLGDMGGPDRYGLIKNEINQIPKISDIINQQKSIKIKTGFEQNKK